MDNAVALAAIALTSTIAIGFFAIVNKQDATYRKLVRALENMAGSNVSIATELKKGNKEAKNRNGHLAELTIQSRDMTMEAIQNVREQHVKHQIVEHEVVKDKNA